MQKYVSLISSLFYEFYFLLEISLTTTEDLFPVGPLHFKKTEHLRNVIKSTKPFNFFKKLNEFYNDASRLDNLLTGQSNFCSYCDIH